MGGGGWGGGGCSEEFQKQPDNVPEPPPVAEEELPQMAYRMASVSEPRPDAVREAFPLKHSSGIEFSS